MNQPAIPLLDARRPLLQVTASRNFARGTDNQYHLYNDSATNITLTIPQNTFAAGDEIELAAIGTGTIAVAGGAGVTVSGALTVAAGAICLLKFYSANAARIFATSAPSVLPGLIFSNTSLNNITAVVTDQVVYSFNLPGGTVKANGCLDFEIAFRCISTTSKGVKIRIGAVDVFVISTTNSNMWHFRKTAYNRSNSLITTSNSSQAIYFASANIAFTNAALDWTIDQTVSVLATVATANQGVEFQFFSVRVQNV